MIRDIQPLSGSVHAHIVVPGSKSHANRALICAALARGESHLLNASDSHDTALLSNGLNQLGVLVRKSGSELIVEGTGGKLYAPKFSIPVGNAGTTFRFLLSLAALAKGKTTFEASARMTERPIADLMDSLAKLGVMVTGFDAQGRCEVAGGSLQGGTIALRAEKSSQFLSSVLMVAPYANEKVTIEIDGPLPSLSYVQMTIDVMKHFGVDVERIESSTFVVKPSTYTPKKFNVEADASGASYFFAAAALCGGEITVKGINRNSSQGDARFVELLGEMGCRVEETREGTTLKSNGTLQGIEVDMNSIPDVVPTLAVTALFAQSPTYIRNVAHLRNKESDRLAALETELRKAGASINISGDGIEIHPAEIHGAQLDTHDDHRLAMSFALIGLKLPGIRIENPDCVKKSFPNFWVEFQKLYAIYTDNIHIQS